MKQGLSKREKILLFSLGTIVVFYIVTQFTLLPLISDVLDGRREIDFLRNEKATVEANLANISIVRSENDNAIEQFNEIKQDFPLLVPNEEIHTILTNLCRINNLSPDGLKIAPPTYSDSDGDAKPVFVYINATMNLSGSFSNLLRLINEVDGIQYIHISSLNYTTIQAGDPSYINIIITFELTFINP